MRTPVVVIGAGQAGLAMSHHLTGRGIDHVVLDRGEVANSWRTERWDSLRLLTPNWMTRLPGHCYDGPDPDGFMTKDETISLLGSYGCSFGAPIRTHVTVQQVRARCDGFEVITDQGTWWCDAVVAATGASSEPRLPAVAGDVPARIDQLTALEYRNPSQLASGDVLVVGGSASGAQIADEIQRSGRRRDRSRSATTSDCRAPTAAATSIGGWTRSGNSTSDTRRSRTSPALGACRRSSSSAAPNVAPSTSTHSLRLACAWSAS